MTPSDILAAAILAENTALHAYAHSLAGAAEAVARHADALLIVLDAEAAEYRGGAAASVSDSIHLARALVVREEALRAARDVGEYAAVAETARLHAFAALPVTP